MPTQNGGKPSPIRGTARTRWSGMPVAPGRGDGRQRHGDQDGQQRPEADQPQRHRQALQHEMAGRDVVEQRLAEVAVDDPAHELLVLDPQRAVEAELVPEQRDACGRRLIPEDRPRRVARHEMNQEEDEDRDAERDRHELEEAARHVRAEAHAALLTTMLSSVATPARRPPGGNSRGGRRRSRAACSCTPSGTASSRGSP